MFFSSHRPAGTELTRDEKVESRCITCHRAGLMPIVVSGQDSVVSYTKKHKANELVDWFNDTLAPQFSNATLAGNKTLDLKIPQLGEINPPQRTEQFMDDCIKESRMSIDRKRIPVVMKAMNCASCHDGDSVGKISYMGDPNNFFGTTLQKIIASGIMPPHNNLSSDEKTVLNQCLKSEYYGGFSAVFTGTKGSGTFLRELTHQECPVSEAK